MKRIFAAVALAFSLTAVSATALANTTATPVAARHQRAEKGDKDKGDKDKKFPMKADEYKRHVAERIAKSRERMEKHITRSKANDDKAKEIRGKFDAAVAKINKKVEEVAADGTVTKEEAKEVFTLFREVAHHHGGKKPHKKLPPGRGLA